MTDFLGQLKHPCEFFGDKMEVIHGNNFVYILQGENPRSEEGWQQIWVSNVPIYFDYSTLLKKEPFSYSGFRAEL